MKNKITYTVTGVALVLGLIIIFSGGGIAKFENIENFDSEMMLYKSQSCGCCGLWVSYFKAQGNPNMEITTFEDQESLDEMKNSLGVPMDLQSCHTAVIGDYFIEGHMPLEVIEKLLTEKPNIKGIALPGMPMGSPGMPGSKTEDFLIYQVNNDGSYEEYMRY